MHDIAVDLLILLAAIWLVAVTLRPLGLPTIMGELIVGVLVGPAVLGWIEPSEAITLLAEIGIFFLMFHAGVETQPREFFDALKKSLGVAVVGALVPFSVSFGVATAFGLDPVAATFVGLTMTATAVVITLKTLRDLGLATTRVARIIVASCVIDDLLTLVFFGLILGVLSGGSFELSQIVVTLFKVVAFFVLAFLLGQHIYPRLALPFRSPGGKGFTFVLFVAIGAGLIAEAIGLHMIIGAYLAGLFFEERVADPRLVRVVADRSYGIAYSFLGPIFFISLGFSITFDISASGLGFLAVLTTAVIVGQVVSAGGMAIRMGLPAAEALTVGVGMCGRAELAFILASLALAQGAITPEVFSVLIFTAFVLNLFTPLGLKGCAVLLAGQAQRAERRGIGILWSDKFGESDDLAADDAHPPTVLPDLTDAVVFFGYGPEVVSLVDELERRELPYLIVDGDEEVARRLHEGGKRVVHSSVSELASDLRALASARSVVLNCDDDDNVVLSLGAREAGFEGQIVALIEDPRRRSPMLFAGADVTFAPTHVLAAMLSARASARISPRLMGARHLQPRIEVAELRVHDESPLANTTLAATQLRTRTGAYIVGQWREAELRAAPEANEVILPGSILVAVGTPESIQRLGTMARPIGEGGDIIVVGFGGVGQKLAEILKAVGEDVLVLDAEDRPGVDVVGDVTDPAVLRCLPLTSARVAVLTLGSESPTVYAATALRADAPDLPIIAGAKRADSIVRMYRAGVDFALSISQVSGQLLAHHVLGETVSLQPRIKLALVSPGRLAGKNPVSARIRPRTGATIVAIRRGDELTMDFPPELRLEPEDGVYVCGTAETIARYREVFDATSL